MRTLGVGVATLDVVSLVDRYPTEDQEIRALDRQLVRGGNCANSLVVLSQLGHHCSWAGMLGSDQGSELVGEDLRRNGVDIRFAVTTPGSLPTSYVTLSRENGSRTIVHFRDLPEYPAEQFRSIDLKLFDWVHLEGREPAALEKMLEATRSAGVRVSLEIEKPRPGIETLFALTNHLLFSKGYALAKGFGDAADFLRSQRWYPGLETISCAWGELGAWAMDSAGNEWWSAAFPPAQLVDTLGAGDVFNAGMIDGLVRQRPLQETLTNACRLAGRKCGVRGFALGIDKG